MGFLLEFLAANLTVKGPQIGMAVYVDFKLVALPECSIADVTVIELARVIMKVLDVNFDFIFLLEFR